MHVVEPYDAHGERKGVFTDPDFDYRDEYNSMFGWRARTYDQMNACLLYTSPSPRDQ